jgi:hypothetical protein
MKKQAIKIVALVIFFVFVVSAGVFAGTTLNADVTIPSVADYEASTTFDLTLKSGSIADSFSYSGGVFTVTNPDTTTGFNVSASSSSVKSFILKSGSNNVACTVNETPGTSYINITNAAGTYTILPSSAITDCGTVCSAVEGVATFNGFPSCVPTSCSTNYVMSSSNTCYIPGSSGGGGGGTYVPIHDIVPPIINNVQFSESNLTFTTNENSKTALLYGITIDYGQTLKDPVYTKKHSFMIPNIVEGVTYYFKIEATDPEGNIGTETGTFTQDGTVEIEKPLVQGALVPFKQLKAGLVVVPDDLTVLSKKELLILIIQILVSQQQ